MSDYGDFCREQRIERQERRRFWHECPTCKISYGTGTSVAPGGNCRNCGWKAPGSPGDDRRSVEAMKRKQVAQKIAKQKARERYFEYECPYCDRKFKNPFNRGQHVKKVHDEEHAERRVKMGKRKTFPELTEAAQ